ncbi:hypothetical protein BGZ61DRAFT_445631 [Ilyonectria robusta]|uniref:uncharacterized protein n=1 Tax=Ilyonectria robusta TaxID=1079257 RepID=UPI001E8DD63A|nr:uncharacterized protein BGZ61DRAFT_445631 [Ilyonectria robusta]KAH8733975.1 hypothetical protein BGZ61DRAFT_445631 [Ilyonectria robusta]
MTGSKHYDTPKKARLRGAHAFLKANGIPFQKSDLFEFFQFSRRSGNRILNAASDRMRHNQPDQPETRGRPKKRSDDDLDQLEQMYEDEGFEAKRLSWSAAVTEAAIQADCRTS